MGKIEELAAKYERHIQAPWQRTVAGAQRVMMVVYEKELERAFRARKGEFEQRTIGAGHGWVEHDCTCSFAQWMATDEYREAYFESPDDLGMKLESEFVESIVQPLRELLRSSDENTVVAVTGVASLYGFAHILLHNTIGAWHAGKILAARPELVESAASEDELRAAVALDGYGFEYLRFVRTQLSGEDRNSGTGPWRPAASAYPEWPRHARELTLLDPCCGSGHFLVAAFDLLVRLRQAEEGLGPKDAIRAVLAENLFGLELDGRCTQIAAFNLALAAWRFASAPIELPPLQIACSGIGPNASKEEWLGLAEAAAARGGMPAKRDLLGREESLLSGALRTGLEQLHETFKLAPEIGSLIDPTRQASDLYVAGFDRLQPLLETVLDAESAGDDLHERAVAAQGMARAARILIGPPAGYTLVVTNVPYLGRGSQGDLLKEFADKHYKDAKADLATIFVSRMMRWLSRGGRSAPAAGTVAAVTPQNWLFLTSYKKLRKRLLKERTWEVIALLGPGAFETIGGHVVNVALLSISGGSPDGTHVMAGLDVSANRGQPPIPAAAKAALLRGKAKTSPPLENAQETSPAERIPEIPESASDGGVPIDGSVRLLLQAEQLGNPDARITYQSQSQLRLLADYARASHGVGTFDSPRFRVMHWETLLDHDTWQMQQTSPEGHQPWGGCLYLLRWENGTGSLAALMSAWEEAGYSSGKWRAGVSEWGSIGVIAGQMGELPTTLYAGFAFDENASAVIANEPSDTPAIWCYLQSEQFRTAIREIDRSIKVTCNSLVKVPVDLDYWRSVAGRQYPSGLPEPRSDDPTQWLFHCHPAHAYSHAALQVAVARLVGHRWPAELAEDLRLAPEARALVRQCAELTEHADGDGIVCLSSIQGEGSGSDRLRPLLAAAFGSAWSAAKEQDLLKAAGDRFAKGKVQRSLEDWLRDRFFEEHCALFHARPFVWHVWDGLPGGFHALVHYHRLAGANGEGRRTLEKLASTYLGEWIDRQRQLAAAGEEGADGRLAAALGLQSELRKILEGAPPYDIFVRWKPLHEQALGWDPDIDDGVRLNIRPFLKAKDVGKKNAGILRAKPDNTWSNAKKPGVKDRGKDPEGLRPKHLFPWFWDCDPDHHREHRLDFGAGTEGSSLVGKAFTGARWNGLHYTRAAKETARSAAAVHPAEEAKS